MPLLKYNSPQSLGRKRLIFCPWAITGVCLHSGITGEPRYGRAQLELITPSGGSIKGRRDQVVGQAPWAKGTAYYKELIYLCNSLFSPVMWNLFNFPHYPFPPSPPPPTWKGFFQHPSLASLTCHASQTHFISSFLFCFTCFSMSHYFHIGSFLS